MSELRKLRTVPVPVGKEAVKLLEELLADAKAGKWNKVLVFVDGPNDVGWRCAGSWGKPELFYATELARKDVVD